MIAPTFKEDPSEKTLFPVRRATELRVYHHQREVWDTLQTGSFWWGPNSTFEAAIYAVVNAARKR